MGKFGFAMGVLAAVAVACNALTGASDLTVCAGAECDGGSGAVDANLTDAPTAVNDGSVVPEASGDPSCPGCSQTCVDGVCQLYPSCRELALKCGTANTSCCDSLAVPGGTFDRANDDDFPATVSPFSLDMYEVTVGRFRAFLESGGGTASSPPAPGAGAHPKIPGSGWKATWNSQLSNSTELFTNALSGSTTFTKERGANEQKPMSFVTWFEAFAFCAWDGGRLPTYAELNFAAVGGEQQRYYPWSVPPRNDSIDETRATYECRYRLPAFECPPATCVGANPAPAGACNAAVCADAGGSCQEPPCTGCDDVEDIAIVGQFPAGAGRWGHLDLAGNMTELTMDARPRNADEDETFPVPCNDCARLMRDNPAGTSGSSSDDDELVFAHGDFGDARYRVAGWSYGTENHRSRFHWLGFRCARDR